MDNHGRNCTCHDCNMSPGEGCLMLIVAAVFLGVGAWMFWALFKVFGWL